MIDHQFLTFADAARLVPGREGRPIHPATVARWALHGIGPPGTRIRLDSVRVGGRRMTTRAALARFIGEVTAARDGCAPHDSTLGNAADGVEAELNKLGL